MKYYMKQKAISFGSDFNIMDEGGKKAFFVDGKAFSFGQQLSFQDGQGNELAFINQKLMTFRKTFDIKRKGKRIARITKSPFSFKDRFFIDLPGPDDITVVGKLIEHEYKFYRNRKQIAEVSKKILAIRDTYGVDIQNESDRILLLCSAVVIDLCCHEKARK